MHIDAGLFELHELKTKCFTIDSYGDTIKENRLPPGLYMCVYISVYMFENHTKCMSLYRHFRSKMYVKAFMVDDSNIK